MRVEGEPGPARQGHHQSRTNLSSLPLPPGLAALPTVLPENSTWPQPGGHNTAKNQRRQDGGQDRNELLWPRIRPHHAPLAQTLALAGDRVPCVRVRQAQTPGLGEGGDLGQLQQHSALPLRCQIPQQDETVWGPDQTLKGPKFKSENETFQTAPDGQRCLFLPAVPSCPRRSPLPGLPELGSLP